MVKKQKNKYIGWAVSFTVHSFLLLLLYSSYAKTEVRNSMMSVQVDYGNSDLNIKAKYVRNKYTPEEKSGRNANETHQEVKSEVLRTAKVATQKKSSIALKSGNNETKKIKKTPAKKKKNSQPKLSKLLKRTLNSLKNNRDQKETTTKSKSEDETVVLSKGKKTGKGRKSKFSTGFGMGNQKGNFQLGDRSPINTPEPLYDCRDQGVVYVRIIVDDEGRVVLAEPGVKGSTTTSTCLMKRAQEAAYNTTWSAGESQTNKQEGRIIYKFSITK